MSEQVFNTADLVLTALHADSRPEDGRSLSAVVEQVDSGSTQLSKQVEIAVAVERLTREGLIDRVGSGRLVLTDTGRDSARETYDSLRTTDVRLADGNEKRSLETVADALGRDLVSVAAECSDDGVYYRQEQPPVSGLVGREDERAVVEATINRVRSTRRGECLLLSGSGGIGKTTLVETILAEQSDPVSTASVRCRSGWSEPYQPLRSVLSQLDIDTDPFTADAVTVEDSETYEAQRNAVFHDITAHLIPDEGVRVLFIDDIELADPGTRGYLTHLSRELESHPLVLVGAHQPGTLPEETPLSPECGQAETTQVTRLTLDGLGRDETRQLVEQVVGKRPAPERFVDAVYERTGGTPLFVEKTVEALLESGQLDDQFEWYPDTVAEIDLPPEARETIGRQLALLDDDTQNVLEWAAVADESAIVSVIETVCERPSRQVSTILDTLVEAGTFDKTHDESRVEFRNGAVCEAILDRLYPGEKKRRHQALADELASTIETTDGQYQNVAAERAAAVAHHFERAETHAQAVRWFQEAADYATDVYAHETAIEYYRRVLDIAQDTESQGPLLETGLELADVYLTIGEYEQAERYLRFVRERLSEADTDGRRRATHLAGAIAVEHGEYDRAIEEVTAGLGLTETVDRVHCQLLATKADAAWAQGDYETARETSEQLRDCTEQVGATDLRATATHQLGVLAMEQSEYDRARQRYEQALKLCEEVGEKHRGADALMGLGIVAKRQEDYETAHEHWSAARDAYDAVGDRHQAAKIANNLGLVAKQQTEYELAREYYEDALQRLEAVGDRDTAALVRTNIGNVAELRGEYEAAREYLERSLETFQAVGRRHYAAVARLNLGDLLTTLEEYDLASDHLQEALDVTQSLDDTLREAKVLSKLGRLERVRENYENATESLDEAFNEATAVENQVLRGKVRIEQARLALDQGDYDRADSCCQDALEWLRDENERVETARATQVRGRVDKDRSNHNRAAESLTQSLETFLETGVLGDALETLEALADCREHESETIRQWCDRLTDRAEVADQTRIVDRVEAIRQSLAE